MAVLEHLEPKRVWYWFEQLCAIPHGSGNIKAVSDWLMDFGRERALECYQDALNNVILIKPASPGYEQAPAVILQGHMDMVCEKEPGCRKDMAREGLDLAEDGNAVYAEETTLGGDDGIAVAMALAVLEAQTLPHPRVEAVFTVDEETGMGGAAGLDVSPLHGRLLLNLDSEDEGIFTVSCAGGNMSCCTLPVRRKDFPGKRMKMTIGGLQGGHSGTEIDKGRGNAALLLGRCLLHCCQAAEVRLVSVNGGRKDNAIPREAAAELVVSDPAAVAAACAHMDDALKREYRMTDPGVFVSVAPADGTALPMDDVSSRRICCFLACAPNGVQAMSAEIPGLVQTSLNLGILETGKDAVAATFCIRSSITTQKEMLVNRLRCLTEQLGGALEVRSDYPAWEYRPESRLREVMVRVFTEQYGHPPRIEAIHAGVECGLLAGKLPGLDCVSLGPDIKDIHTPRERLYIASVQRTWQLLLEVLRRMK